MGFNLYKVSKELWAVQHQPKGSNKTEVNKFISIEGAASFLESIGVHDDEIDNALAFIYGHEHTRAHFGLNGYFIFSDSETLSELSGVA